MIHEDKEYLRYCWKEIERHVNELGLSLNAKTNIYPLKNGIDFLGFHSYLTESGAVIRKVRRKSKNNARRRLTKSAGCWKLEKSRRKRWNNPIKAGAATRRREIAIT